jgi:ribonuclease P protein component
MSAVGRLKKRADFVAARKGRRVESRSFSLQMRRRGETGRREELDFGPRIGFTVTKQVGDAVERNRIRRRLREAVRRDPALQLGEGCDYVLIARRDAISAEFSALMSEIRAATTNVHMPRPVKAGSSGRRRRDQSSE